MAQLYGGYHFTWQSSVAPHNGEDAYAELVQKHLAEDKDVLDAGCGHGDFTLAIASYCKSVWAYDRVQSFIEVAQALASERMIQNVTFICADSGAGERGHVPVADNSFDLLISRRGDLRWIEDAKRIGRPGSVLLQLNPWQDPAGTPVWNDELPPLFRFTKHTFDMREVIERRLAVGGLTLHSCWTFDVPEVLPNPEQLYRRLIWGFAQDEVPAWQEMQSTLERIFERYATAEGVELRQRRFLWKAVVKK
jgi:23S rRNA (guanine745-N1)-methyltransferase